MTFIKPAISLRAMSGVGEGKYFEVPESRRKDYIDKRKVRRLDVFSRYAVAAARMAAEDAGFDPRPEAEQKSRSGVVDWPVWFVTVTS